MAKKRLNKNLVAFVTAGGIFLAVLVVAIAAFNASRRDPEVIADRARAAVKSGDYERAVRLFQQAYKQKSEAKYLIEAAEVERTRGQLQNMFAMLNLAHTQSPRDPEILGALLRRYWEMRRYPMGQWDSVRQRAESLLELPGHDRDPLALASLVDALDHLAARDSKFASSAEDALAKAIEADATNAYVAIVHADHVLRTARQASLDASRSGDSERAKQLVADARKQQIEILQPSLAKHPDVVELRVALADALAADKQWDVCQKMLEAGLAQQGDNVDLHYAMAGMLLNRALQEWQDAPAEDVQAWVRQGIEHCDKAIALAPALYDAYARKAQLQRIGWLKDGKWDRERLACGKAILAGFAKALDDTVGVRSLRAALGKGARLQLIAQAFDFALNLYRTSNEADVRTQAITYMKRFLQEGQTQYPQHSLSALMEGHLAEIEGDDRRAVKAFEKTIEQVQKGMGPTAFANLARQELVRIYRRSEKLGLSLRYTQELLAYYRNTGQKPPLWLYLNEAEVLTQLNRRQEALDLVDSISPQYPDDPRLRTMRARLLALANRGKEAEKLLESASSDDPRMWVNQARVAAYNKNFDEAVRLLNKAIEAVPNSSSAIRLMVTTLMHADRKDEALDFVRKQLASTKSDSIKRMLQSYEVMLTEDDPGRQQEKLLAIIKTIPDEFDRAAEYFNYWVARGDADRAAPYLDQMEKLRDDDVRIKELQFDMALRRHQCDRAQEYAGKLAKLNADQVNGATYRGRYELACGDASKALSEYRAAERDFPNDPDVKVRIAQALLSLKPPKMDEAARALEKAVEYDPRNFVAQRLLYTVYEQLGRHSDAIPHLEAAAEIKPDDPFIKERKQLLDEQKDPQAGIAIREKQRAEHPDDVNNLLRLVDLYTRVGDKDKARACLEQAFKAKPDSAAVAQTAADFYSRTGDRAAGEKLLRAHLKTQKGTDEILARILIAKFFERLGDTEAALAEYTQAENRVREIFSADSPDARRAVSLVAYQLAEFHRRQHDYAKMVDAYKLLLKNLSPDNVASIQSARRAVVRGYLALQKFDEAKREMDAYRRDYPKDPAGMLAEAELLMTSPHADVQQARSLLSQVIEAEPSNAWAYYLRARVATRLNQFPDARDDLIKAKSLSPEGFQLRHRLDLAQLYELMDRPELAETELREMLPLKRPDRTVELRLINLLIRTKQYEKAQAFVGEMIAQHPSESFWPYQLGKLLITREQYSAAVKPLRQAIELVRGGGRLAPEDVYASLLYALTRAKRADEAVQAYDSFPPEVITPRIQIEAARAAMAAGRREAGLALVEQALAAAVKRSSAMLHFVAALAVDDEVAGRDATIDALRRMLAAEQDPQAQHALRTTLAWYLVESPNAQARAEGAQLVEQVLAATGPKDAARGEALLVKAHAMEVAGDKSEKTLKIYEQVLQVDPKNLQALNNLAFRLADKFNRAKEALPYAERLRQVAPRNVDILDTVGWVYLKNGKTRDAISVLQDALRINPDHIAAQYHLGVALAANGDKAGARRVLQRVVEQARGKKNKEYEQRAVEALGKL